jgi:transcriptional regulator with XRE-family HTH domain
MDAPGPDPDAVLDGATRPIEIGQRIRSARTHRKASMRALAKAVGISQSALSQIETGKSQPSVRTLYRLVRELGISLDELVGLDSGAAGEACLGGVPPDSEIDLVPSDEQKRIDLDSGVTWYRLTGRAPAGVNFFRIVHRSGSGSAPAGKYASHTGREFIYVLSGTLRLEVGFDAKHVLHTGDALSFPATTPHRASNPGPDAAEIICVIVDDH